MFWPPSTRGFWGHKGTALGRARPSWALPGSCKMPRSQTGPRWPRTSLVRGKTSPRSRVGVKPPPLGAALGLVGCADSKVDGLA